MTKETRLYRNKTCKAQGKPLPYPSEEEEVKEDKPKEKK